jgi:hypothetical protein
MQILISRSGLVLNPGQMADLVLAWRQVAGLIAAIPQGRPLADDLAYSFRLPPAAPVSGAPKPAAKPAARAASKPAPRSAAKAGAKPQSRAAAQSRATPQSPGTSKAAPKSGAKPRPQAARHRASSGR